MNKRTVDRYPAMEFNINNWILSIYVFKASETEFISFQEISKIIEMNLINLEKDCISTEFDYYRTGVAFLHYGRRGIELSIWHVGLWGNTFEYFCCTWYCYCRDVNNMELLDNAEPHLSQYEVEILSKELLNIHQLAREEPTKNGFRNRFLKETG